ncbi:molybdenum cofactor synthesis domain-containing protein [Promicromonospora umidemergens]|uniref:MogA/MoaB family molybdenum cofactor biosynthesis protein n=1 Tax=Promicromonospora umidemergens TaxID=629679 RepID=A0ABP8WX92_9MICO|nr:MogA/MoaB family molybdenum cofactor biosynthesis protein [Promicromonospora umidemergens]MCP2283750.1 molybdenum cofactor synthesis domain-containing protein [Promicromonospora umidemergens]
MTSDRVAVITVSDRCARGEAEDRSGPTAVALLREAGLTDVRNHLVPDGVESVRDVLRTALDDGARLVITTGGTGIAPRDLTPEGTRAVLDYEIPGIAEAVRQQGVAAGVPTAALSRGLAGLARAADGARALVVNLPGSSGGVRDGLEVVLTLWPHVRTQLEGGDH